MNELEELLESSVEGRRLIDRDRYERTGWQLPAGLQGDKPVVDFTAECGERDPQRFELRVIEVGALLRWWWWWRWW